jgi:hypothetical protein
MNDDFQHLVSILQWAANLPLVPVTGAGRMITVNEARAALLETLAEEMELHLHQVVREYDRNSEFKRRIDLAALSISAPTSQTIH